MNGCFEGYYWREVTSRVCVCVLGRGEGRGVAGGGGGSKNLETDFLCRKMRLDVRLFWVLCPVI